MRRQADRPAAASELSNERAVPQVSLSFRMNLTAFGFGVSSMSAILGMIGGMIGQGIGVAFG